MPPLIARIKTTKEEVKMGGRIDKNSILQQVYRALDENPTMPLKQLMSLFPFEEKTKIANYLTRYRKIHAPKPLNVKEELEKIIKNYRFTASTRVQALREYQRILENEPKEEGKDNGDIILSLFKTIESEEKDKDA